MQGIRRFLAGSERIVAGIGTTGAALSSIVLFLMVVFVFADIVLRALTGRSLDFVTVTVGYAVAAITFGSLAHALRRDELIRVSLLSAVLRRHPYLDRLLYCLVLVVTILIMGLASWYFGLSVARNWSRGVVSMTRTQIPMWIPEGLMLLGMLLFLAQALLHLLNTLVGNARSGGTTLAGTGEKSGGQ